MMTTSPVCEPKPQVSTLPPWGVILHNDEVNTAEFVAEKVQEITKLEEEVAVSKVLEAHKKGRALLVTTHQEKAELFVEQFTSYKISATAEKT